MNDILTWRRLRRLSLFDLEVFVLLSQKMNSNKVAESLDVLPSKVSRTLSGLRDTFNDPLFVRRQRGFEPTPLAMRLYPRADALLEMAKEMPHELMQPEAANSNARIRISTPTALSQGLLKHLRTLAEARGEKLDIAVVTGGTEPVAPNDSNQVDMAIYYGFEPWKHVESRLICYNNNPMVVAVKDHPIWQRKAELHLAMLDFPFVVNELPSFNEGRDPMEDYANAMGRTLEIEARVSSLPDLVAILQEGRAYSIIGGRGSQEYLEAHGNIVAVTMPALLRRKLHSLFSGNSTNLGVYLHCNKPSLCPGWLVEALTQFVKRNYEG